MSKIAIYTRFPLTGHSLTGLPFNYLPPKKNRLIKHNLLLFGWQQLDIDASVFTSCQKAGGGGS